MNTVGVGARHLRAGLASLRVADCEERVQAEPASGWRWSPWSTQGRNVRFDGIGAIFVNLSYHCCQLIDMILTPKPAMQGDDVRGSLFRGQVGG